MPDDEKTPEESWRMSAYYYSFVPTGLAVVDKILSAVAAAGKMWHNTSEWQSPSYDTEDAQVDKCYPHLRGRTCQEAIQNAAADAAEAIGRMKVAYGAKVNAIAAALGHLDAEDHDEARRVLEDA